MKKQYQRTMVSIVCCATVDVLTASTFKVWQEQDDPFFE